MKFTKYILTAVFLAFSASCSTAADNNQSNAVSQNSAESGTASSISDKETSEAQTAAPDAVVKELLKLHKTDKSPLYRAKTRAEMEKFFSKDFVNLVWTGGSEPNLMNKLPIDGDLLLGLDPLSNSEGETVGKARIDGDQATVPVTINVIDANDEKSKNLDNYELVKEKGGWRVSDVKHSTGSLVGTIRNLQKTAKDSDKDLDEEFRSDKVPFVGKRWFNTDKEGSGSGTPQYYLRITEDNYAFCGFVQTNQASGKVTEEELPLGKFRKTFDCNFKNDLGGKYSYQVEGNYIYELDKNDKIIEESKSEFYEGN